MLLDFHGKNSYHCGMKSIVSEKGQVTIPKLLRDRLGIRTGQVLDFRDERGQLVATKAHQEDAVDSVYGILKLRRGTNKLITSLRGSPDAV